MNKQAVRKILVSIALTFCVLLLVRAFAHGIASGVLPLNDFVEYWSAARVNLSGGNPYAADQLLTLQRELGWSEDRPLQMWNPPWTLGMMLPLGLLSYPLARGLWFLFGVTVVFLYAGWTWDQYGGSRRHRAIAFLIAFTFLPTLVQLKLGQSAPVMLLGILGFLQFQRRPRWWLCGAAVALTTIKPQLLYLFLLALLLWIVKERRWQVLWGALLTGLLATAAAVISNQAVLQQYLHTVATVPPFYWQTPTLGSALRSLFGAEKIWLQFLPAVLGAVWLLLYWHRYRDDWQWAKTMPLLLLVSVATTAYGWTFDQVVLLLPIIQIAAEASKRGDRRAVALLSVWWVTLDGVLLWLNRIDAPQEVHVWLAPLLLAAYLLARQWLNTGAPASPHKRVEAPTGKLARG